MEFNDLLKSAKLNLDKTLVLRHVPQEPSLRKVMPWLAAERSDLFNAYQQTQYPKVEKQMLKAQYVASFLGRGTGKAVFIGIYEMRGAKYVTRAQRRKMAEHLELVSFGMDDSKQRKAFKLFDLLETEFLSNWKGKLIIRWPTPGIVWSRWAGPNQFEVEAILEESTLVGNMPDWRTLVLTWDELQVMPKKWQQKLSEWRGIYLILDANNGKGYVGSAYGTENIHGRWLSYKKSGHGNNKLLLRCNPSDLRFSILERVSPDMDSKEIINRENSWKERLHTRQHGLNGN